MISTATELNVGYAVKRELLGALQLILESPNIQQAVNVLRDLVTKFDCELLSLEFADIEGVGDIIRPFSGFPKVIRDISAAMKPAGGCPFTKEAVQRLRPFASSCINRSNYTTLNDKIFFREIDKLDRNDIALLPVVIGRGIAIATVGLNKNDFEGKTRQSICDSTPHVMAAFISRFPEIGTLFERKLLSVWKKRHL